MPSVPSRTFPCAMDPKDTLTLDEEFDATGTMEFMTNAHGGRMKYPVYMSEESAIHIVSHIMSALRDRGFKTNWEVTTPGENKSYYHG